MCFRSRILCVVFSFIVALLGLLPIRLLRLIVTMFLGKFWSATAVDAVCSHLVKVKVCLVIDWWSWLLRSYNIFQKVINRFFSGACHFLLSGELLPMFYWFNYFTTIKLYVFREWMCAYMRTFVLNLFHQHFICILAVPYHAKCPLFGNDRIQKGKTLAFCKLKMLVVIDGLQ